MTSRVEVHTLLDVISPFNPQTDCVKQWLRNIDQHASVYGWDETIIKHQCLNKLKGSAKIWFDNFIKGEVEWVLFSWKRWKRILNNTFTTQANTYENFMEVATHRPESGASLYSYFFEHLSKIDKLGANFSEEDKISLVLGGIGDAHITETVEAGGLKKLNELGNFLRNKSMKKPVHSVAKPSGSKWSRNVTDARESRCFTCGQRGHVKEDCRSKDKICNVCGVREHLRAVCTKF